jgi:hypothetical protein
VTGVVSASGEVALSFPPGNGGISGGILVPITGFLLFVKKERPAVGGGGGVVVDSFLVFFLSVLFLAGVEIACGAIILVGATVVGGDGLAGGGAGTGGLVEIQSAHTSIRGLVSGLAWYTGPMVTVFGFLSVAVTRTSAGVAHATGGCEHALRASLTKTKRPGLPSSSLTQRLVLKSGTWNCW